LRDRKIAELLEAVETDPNVYAIVGGKGDLEPLIRLRAARNPRIVYVGFVKGDDIPRYTCAADIVYYGFDPENPNAKFSAPNKLYEALAAGRPLVTGDFGEIAEVVRNGECGVVLPEYSAATVGEAIATLTNPELRARFAANAKRLGETTMNWNRGEETLFEEYSALLSKPLITPDSRVSAAEGRP
jgi:glycosyltransferase involved in cell wall biosynthesis